VGRPFSLAAGRPGPLVAGVPPSLAFWAVFFWKKKKKDGRPASVWAAPFRAPHLQGPRAGTAAISQGGRAPILLGSVRKQATVFYKRPGRPGNAARGVSIGFNPENRRGKLNRFPGMDAWRAKSRPWPSSSTRFSRRDKTRRARPVTRGEGGFRSPVSTRARPGRNLHDNASGGPAQRGLRVDPSVGRLLHQPNPRNPPFQWERKSSGPRQKSKKVVKVKLNAGLFTTRIALMGRWPWLVRGRPLTIGFRAPGRVSKGEIFFPKRQRLERGQATGAPTSRSPPSLGVL